MDNDIRIYPVGRRQWPRWIIFNRTTSMAWTGTRWSDEQDDACLYADKKLVEADCTSLRVGQAIDDEEGREP